MKCNCLEVLGCCSSTTKYEVFGPVAAVLLTPLSSVCCMTWLAGIWVSGMARMYSLADSAVAAAVQSVAPMWKWHWS